LNRIPWIAEVENFQYLNAFFSYFNREDFFSRKMNFIGKEITSKALNSKYCKKIVCLSEYSKKTVLFFGGQKLKEKTCVCFPAVNAAKRKKKGKEISLLFVATNPVFKGTEFVFSAFNKLKEKYDIKLNCMGNFSEETKRRFPDINFGFVSGKEFKDKVLPENHILLMPSLVESFGFTALQAFANAIPVVSSDVMALPEINQENKTGFLVRFPKTYHEKLFVNPYYFINALKELKNEAIVSELVNKTSLLIEDSSLRKKLGRNAFREIEKGKFSIKARIERIKEIFFESNKNFNGNFF
jgi:glycosyltransferase involved in cell wall biosynthesis